jgi:prepilin-type N-terminal cleavage/methylation domain-containing protein
MTSFTITPWNWFSERLLKKNLRFWASGFTLVEVIVCVFLITIGCLTAGFLQIASLKSKITAENVTIATFLAQSEMERLKTLSHNELSRLNDYENDNINRLGAPCGSGPCRGQSFKRKVKFYEGTPTPMSYHVEIDIAWRDSAGGHNILYSESLTASSHF